MQEQHLGHLQRSQRYLLSSPLCYLSPCEWDSILAPGLTTRSWKVWEGCSTPARGQPLLCTSSLPQSTEWRPPEQHCLLRLLPPRFPSAHQMGPHWQGGESRSDPHLPCPHTAWNLAILSKLVSLGWILSVPRIFLSRLPLQFQPPTLLVIQTKWMQLLKSSPQILPIYFWGNVGI